MFGALGFFFTTPPILKHPKKDEGVEEKSEVKVDD